MSNLSISNVINISVSQTGTGIGAYNTSNLAIFSNEAYGLGFGTDGYKIYLGPEEVAIDFGSDSITYQQALAVFSQQPNIKAADGYLVVIPAIVQEWSLTPASAPTSGAYSFTYDGNNSDPIAWDATAAQIQAIVRLVPGLSKAVVLGTFATAVVISGFGTYGDLDGAITENSNSLDDGAAVAVVIGDDITGETAADSILRTIGLIEYFGIINTQILAEADMLAAAALVQTLNKIAAFASILEADIEVGGKLDLLRSGSLFNSRGLYYGGATDLSGLLFMAAYMGRGLSTNFSGSNTTQTMHLKDLATIQPDPTMTQNILNKSQAAGADNYISIQGVSKTFTSGANEFFDFVYNLQWFVGALEVAGFNTLAQLGTKLPQTEGGMDALKSSYRLICEQSVTNQFTAPGKWTSPTTFGVQSDLLSNITQRGYYIYSVPVSQQPQADREARKAPLVQIAIKTAGAIHSSTVIVNVNK